MLLEKLVEFAEVQLGTDLPPAGYQLQPLRYVIDLDSGGTVRGVVDTASKESKRGEQRLAPHAKRAMGIVPKLLADTGEYVLGIARNDPKKPPNPVRVAQQHEQFRDIVQRCADDTKLADVHAVASFLTGHEPESQPDWLPGDYDPSATITFRVNGKLPIDDPQVRAWWAATRAPDADDVDGSALACIVCGKVGPVLERHPLKIKGIPGGQIQKDLISANAGAFESYGLPASMIAPTCPVCAEAYGNALNALLADKSTSMWAGGLAYAFWTDPKEPTNPFLAAPILQKPDENAGQVAELLKAAHRGKQDAMFLDPTAFYCVAFGASGARVVVKDWIDTTVGKAKASVANYFALQEMVDWNGELGSPVSIQGLARSTLRQGAKMTDAPPDVVTQALFRLAIKGTPLPDDLLFMAVRRNRAEQSVTRNRAMLIRMVLEPKLRARGEDTTLSGLDPERGDPAYVCGRLLAIFNDIQEAALPGVNASVVDKYYGSASTNPALVFPLLSRGAQAHLKRLLRDNERAARALQARLEDVVAMIDDFPRALNLEKQGEFALGFYHQRAATRAARRAAAEARKAQATPESTAA